MGTPRNGRTWLLACGDIVEKYPYCALATTGCGKSATVTGCPVAGFMTMITGSCVEEPNMGDEVSAMAGVPREIRLTIINRRLNIGYLGTEIALDALKACLVSERLMATLSPGGVLAPTSLIW
jgi:hypothetical protein